jgi:2-polyprenyl-3-methyl-5-hydroxy-6-metoxy-1,4-benzoquinol methylase
MISVPIATTMVDQPEKWPVIRDRTSYIRDLARGLDVLDLGCAGKKANGRIPDPATTLHHAIEPVCKSLVGVDVDSEAVRRMTEAGFNALCDDITSMNLHHRFDLVVAGEIIEHLLNPASALRNLAKHLKEDGTLVLTTSNPFYYRQQSKILRRGHIQVHREHTAWYDPRTLSVMLHGSGFRLAKRWRKYWNPSFLVEAKLQEYTPNPRETQGRDA